MKRHPKDSQEEKLSPSIERFLAEPDYVAPAGVDEVAIAEDEAQAARRREEEPEKPLFIMGKHSYPLEQHAPTGP